ncbi:MAG: hypothetical protein AAGF23_03475 [Acidobacteriota bacterium]
MSERPSTELPLPEGTLRLFDGYDAEVLSRPESRDFVIERLLEAGDGDDLRFLTGAVPESDLLRVFRTAKGLMVRTRRFWALVLEGRLDVEPAPHDAIWPL